MKSTELSFLALVFAFLSLLTSCGRVRETEDPAPSLPLIQAPPDTRAFFTPGIDPGVLYAYITAQGEIFIYRRDLDKYAWVTLDQFKMLVAHASMQSGRIIYTLEDGDLHDPKNRAAFMVIHESHTPTQDPVDILPLAKKTRPVE